MEAVVKSGVRPSTVALPVGPWPTVLAFLCERFSNIEPEVWQQRFARGRVLDAHHQALPVDAPYQAGMLIRYFREVPNEPVIPFTERIVFEDEHLVVVDKPHFLPVMPAGVFVEQTLLARLTRRFSGQDLAPLHRIDRHTAGLVMFSNNPTSRDAYHKLFRDRLIDKTYHAWAPALANRSFPMTYQSRIVTGEPFFRSQEVPGEPNSQTHIEVLEQGRHFWRYGLTPVTGRKHQLRVQLAALGAPICNDPIYPEVGELDAADDYQRPLKLLAKELRFTDPLTQMPRRFVSQLDLDEPLIFT